MQSLIFIPEPDLYRLIFSSKLPSAERFEQWVVGTILPSIRKTGSYSVTGNTGTSAIEAVQALIDDYKALKLQYDQLFSSTT